MQRANNLNKPVWFLNPWFDIIILAGFPFALISIPSIYYSWRHFPDAQYYLYSASNFPHVFSTLTMVYLSPQACKKKPVMFLGIPAVIFIGTIIFWGLGYSHQLSHIRFYWGVWHMFTQYYFILQLSKLRNRDYLKTDKILDTLALAIGPACLYLYHSSPFLIKSTIGAVFIISIAKYLLRYPVILIGLIAAAFIVRQAYLLIRWKKIYPFKILMVSVGTLTYIIPLMIFKSTGAAKEIAITFHSLQYLAWVWLYLRQGFKGKTVKEDGFISYLSQPGHAEQYIFFLILSGVLFMFMVMGAATLGFSPYSVYSTITCPLILVHFWLDRRILITNKQIWSGDIGPIAN